MKERKTLPLIKKNHTPVSPEQASMLSSKEAGERDPFPNSTAGTHLGSSDAFMQTENTSSPDADNISDEKLDELLNES